MPGSLLRPSCLQTGDHVALLSPASPPRDPSMVSRAQTRLQALGFQVHSGRTARQRQGYLAGPDRARSSDLERAFTSPQIKGVFCTRGGYGVSRLLEHLDLDRLRRHPKVLVGFSDLTLLHLALQKVGLVSFWGPMPGASTGISDWSWKWLQRAVFSSQPLGKIPAVGGQTLRSGQTSGRMTGGTLSLLAASLGAPYEVRTRNRIVFLEDIGEEPYRIDRMLTQLLAAGKLKDAAGIVLGKFTDCEPRKTRPSFWLREVLIDRLRPLGVPVYSGLPVGHIANQVTLPYGVKARMDARAKTLEILEAGVR